MLSIVLDAENRVVNKTDKIAVLLNLSLHQNIYLYGI